MIENAEVSIEHIRMFAVGSKVRQHQRRSKNGWIVEIVRPLLDYKNLETRVGGRQSTSRNAC